MIESWNWSHQRVRHHLEIPCRRSKDNFSCVIGSAAQKTEPGFCTVGLMADALKNAR